MIQQHSRPCSEITYRSKNILKGTYNLSFLVHLVVTEEIAFRAELLKVDDVAYLFATSIKFLANSSSNSNTRLRQTLLQLNSLKAYFLTLDPT